MFHRSNRAMILHRVPTPVVFSSVYFLLTLLGCLPNTRHSRLPDLPVLVLLVLWANGTEKKQLGTSNADDIRRIASIDYFTQG